MTPLSIVPVGDSAAVVLPPEVLESLGLKVGDRLDATLNDRQLILRPIEDLDRRQRMDGLIREVLEQRQNAYRRLA